MAAFGKGGILHLPFRKTRWHIATFTLAGNVLFYIKGASVSSSHSFCLNLSLCFPILFLTLFFGLSVLVRVSPVLLFYYLWFSGLSSVLYFSLDLTFVCLSFVACFLGLDFGFHIGHQLIKACFLFSTCLSLCACIWVLFWTVTTSINERDAAYYILADTVKHNAQLLGEKKKSFLMLLVGETTCVTTSFVTLTFSYTFCHKDFLCYTLFLHWFWNDIPFVNTHTQRTSWCHHCEIKDKSLIHLNPDAIQLFI